MGTIPFYKAFGNRAINCGIMEAHAVGLAAGLSATGFVPFLHAFGTFASRRAYDQVFLSCAYQRLNVKIIGADAGVTATANGGTHMPFEDMGIMRNIPDMTVIEPADSAMIPYAVSYMAKTYGNFYMRFGRRKTVRIYGLQERFVVGKANVLKEGGDVALIACGILVFEAIKAARILGEEGIDAMVIDMHTVKPIDAQSVVDAAKRLPRRRDGGEPQCHKRSRERGRRGAVRKLPCAARARGRAGYLRRGGNAGLPDGKVPSDR